MDARKKTIARLREHVKDSERKSLEAQMESAGIQGQVRVAGEMPPPPMKAGGNGIDNEVGGHLKRAIPSDYDYDPRALKPLAKMSWALSIALGHAMTAHRQFTKLKSATISPDGLIGGRGYVMSVKDVRKALYDACESISAVADTIHDEIHGPHWRPKLAELEKEDVEVVERLVGEADKNLEDPEGEVEEEMDEAEKEGDRAELEADETGSGSEIPDGEGMVDSIPDKGTPKTAASLTLQERILKRWANSSIPVQTEPGGPRVQHLDRGDVDQTGPYGSYNSEEPHSQNDEWSKNDGVGNDYIYTSEWDNDLSGKSASKWPARPEDNFDLGPSPSLSDIRELVVSLKKGRPPSQILNSYAGRKYKLTQEDLNSFLKMDERGLLKSATSVVPDSNTDPTRTEGYDFGLGYGEGNDAHGQGAGGYANPDPDGKGVFGPYAELPHSPGQRVYENENDTTPSVELAVSKKALVWKVGSALPNDGQPGVARSDYYQGEKGSNQFNTVRGDSEMPGSGPRNDFESDMDVQPGLGYRFEQGAEPYVKWDDDTHNMRPDSINQRDDEGPYVREG